MGLEVYYPTDIRNALLAAEQAVNETAHATSSLDDPVAASFLAGYRAALTTLAIAFGLARSPEATQKERDPASRSRRVRSIRLPGELR